MNDAIVVNNAVMRDGRESFKHSVKLQKIPEWLLANSKLPEKESQIIDEYSQADQNKFAY